MSHIEHGFTYPKGSTVRVQFSFERFFAAKSSKSEFWNVFRSHLGTPLCLPSGTHNLLRRPLMLVPWDIADWFSRVSWHIFFERRQKFHRSNVFRSPESLFFLIYHPFHWATSSWRGSKLVEEPWYRRNRILLE